MLQHSEFRSTWWFVIRSACPPVQKESTTSILLTTWAAHVGCPPLTLSQAEGALAVAEAGRPRRGAAGLPSLQHLSDSGAGAPRCVPIRLLYAVARYCHSSGRRTGTRAIKSRLWYVHGLTNAPMHAIMMEHNAVCACIHAAAPGAISNQWCCPFSVVSHAAAASRGDGRVAASQQIQAGNPHKIWFLCAAGCPAGLAAPRQAAKRRRRQLASRVSALSIFWT